MVNVLNLGSAMELEELVRNVRYVLIKFCRGPTKYDSIFTANAIASGSSKDKAFVNIHIPADAADDHPLKAVEVRYNKEKVYPALVSIANGNATKPISGRELDEHLLGPGAVEDEKVSADWIGDKITKPYVDITSQVSKPAMVLANGAAEHGDIQCLIKSTKPAALSGKDDVKDYVVSDCDEELLLTVGFRSILKLYTIQITSCVSIDEDVDDAPMRPKVVKIFANTPDCDFDDVKDGTPTDTFEISEGQWNSEATVSLPLKFVRYQKISSVSIFIQEGDGSQDSEKTRVDRVRFIGEVGEKREMGELKKLAHD